MSTKSCSSAIRIIHGDKDRVTSHLTTMKFFERISSKDKELQIYEGYEHIMNKVRPYLIRKQIVRRLTSA